jgi:hypothetical protein
VAHIDLRQKKTDFTKTKRNGRVTVPFLDFDWESLRKSIQEIEGYTHKGDHEVCEERGGGEVFHDLCFHPDSLLFF